MATPGFGASPFILPNQFQSPGQTLQGISDDRRQDQQIASQTEYRRQKDDEADQWKKLNLIQDLTDLTKHQTGSDVANAVGNQQASYILQKYTQAAKSMAPDELMAMVQRDMSGLISGMEGMKNELDITDEELKLIKAQYPGVNISEAARMKRSDILNRRLKGDSFINPLEVQPSQFNLGDPEVLSEFITDDSGIMKAITNPQGGEPESVLMGKQGDYTKFDGKLNYWKKPNYDRDKFNSEGFYTGKDMPSFVTKGSELPSDALPSSSGKPFKVIDKDVLDQFTSDANQRLGLIAATKRRFKDYNSFNQQEKEYAQRNVLYDMVETLDPSQLHPTANVRPFKQSIHVSGGSTKAPTQIDLREYPDVAGGGKDITSLMQGVDVVSLVTGKKFAAENVIFNPSTKQITLVDPLNKQPETMSLTTFLQNIKPQNPAADIKWLKDGLNNAITGAAPQKQTTPEPAKPTEKTPWWEKAAPSKTGDNKKTYKGLDKDGNPIFE